jgi:hypothetical protein
MRRTTVVGAVLGLGLLAAAVGPGDPIPAAGSTGTEVHAALDMFLEIKGVKGESRDKAYPNG